jgi:hypothetical protein
MYRILAGLDGLTSKGFANTGTRSVTFEKRASANAFGGRIANSGGLVMHATETGNTAT